MIGNVIFPTIYMMPTDKQDAYNKKEHLKYHFLLSNMAGPREKRWTYQGAEVDSVAISICFTGAPVFAFSSHADTAKLTLTVDVGGTEEPEKLMQII